MKILLATDGSSFSEVAVDRVASRAWPAGTEIKVLYVVHSAIPDVPDPLLVLYAERMQTLDYERKHGMETVEQAAQTAARGGVRTLVLTHPVPAPAPGTEAAWIAIATPHFDGEVILAAHLTTWET